MRTRFAGRPPRLPRVRAGALVGVFAAAIGWSTGASAQFDYALSGYGTLGYAKSTSDETYDRFITRGGTLRRDSVAGIQIDAKAWNDFGATVQIKGAPTTDEDHRYEASVAWAFLSWRPSNDWLLRVGKQRIPYYLYSESFDVGASYAFARLPIEVYSLAPSNDFIGVSAQKTWHVGDGEGEFTLSGNYGRSTNDFRSWLRDTIPQVQNAGAQFLRLTFLGGGLVGTYRDDDHVLRVALVRGTIKPAHSTDALPSDFPFVQIAPGIGYYQVSNALPGPGVRTTDKITDTLFTIGAQTALPGGLQFIGEFNRVIGDGSPYAPRGNRGYASLLRPIEKWTPYAYYAFLKSPQSQIDRYMALNDNAVPFFIPGAAAINASQRIGADADLAYDQSAVAVGTAYAVTATSKLKAEFLRTRIGAVSQLVDVAPGATPRRLHINTLSLSYSVVFQ